MNEEIKAAETAAAPTTATIEPGEFAQVLSGKNIKVNSLGKSASGTEMIELEPADLIAAVKELKKTKQLNFLNYMTAVEVKKGYQNIIQIDNLDEKKYLVIKVTVPKDNPVIPSLTELYPSANWLEREAYDMIGITFEGHPNLTRILNPDKWEGYPLRKDYIGPVDELNQPLKYVSKN